MIHEIVSILKFCVACVTYFSYACTVGDSKGARRGKVPPGAVKLAKAVDLKLNTSLSL